MSHLTRPAYVRALSCPDPAEATGKEAEIRLAPSEAHRMLQNRISIFVNLPIRSLDKLSLQRRLDEIGKTFPESA